MFTVSAKNWHSNRSSLGPYPEVRNAITIELKVSSLPEENGCESSELIISFMIRTNFPLLINFNSPSSSFSLSAVIAVGESLLIGGMCKVAMSGQSRIVTHH